MIEQSGTTRSLSIPKSIFKRVGAKSKLNFFNRTKTLTHNIKLQETSIPDILTVRPKKVEKKPLEKTILTFKEKAKTTLEFTKHRLGEIKKNQLTK